MKNLKSIATLVILLMVTGIMTGQPKNNNQVNPDPLGKAFFPPELVMQHQQSLGLTKNQKQDLIQKVQNAQTKFTEWHWELQEDMEEMVKLASQSKVDESGVMEKLDEILETESKIKKGQLSLMIQIKNSLTQEQQKILKELMNRN